MKIWIGSIIEVNNEEKVEENKDCTRCGVNHPVETYHYANKSKGIRKSVCKDCSYEYAKEHIAQDPIAHFHYMQRYIRENREKYSGNHLSKSTVKQCGVYRLSCVLTDDSYIGCSTNIKDRIYKHSKANGRAKQRNLYKLIKEYGWDAFEVEILEECDKAILFERETFYMKKLKPNLNTNKNK